jgi:hypothetical protein
VAVISAIISLLQLTTANPSHQATSVTMVQKVHANNSALVLGSSNSISNPGQLVSFVASVSSVQAGVGTPTGMVTFFDGSLPIGQVPLNTSGQAVFQTAGLGLGVHDILACTLQTQRLEPASINGNNSLDQ